MPRKVLNWLLYYHGLKVSRPYKLLSRNHWEAITVADGGVGVSLEDNPPLKTLNSVLTEIIYLLAP